MADRVIVALTFALLVGGGKGESSTNSSSDHFSAEDYDHEADEAYCVYDPDQLFYQNRETGTICCRGKVLPMANVIKPEVTGDCAISTKTRSNGTLNSAPIWCAYTCQLKKLGLIESDGKLNPEKFHEHLSVGISASSKAKLKIIMTKHLKCWNPMKHPKLPCYTPLSFHKCWKDAVEYLCTTGMPKDNDFSVVPKVKFDYTNIVPSCYYDDHRSMPGCCHGHPLPWVISDIVASVNTKPDLMTSCLDKVGNATECVSTCFMNSIGVVDDSMEISIKTFEKQILKYFPFVKPSMWMNTLGPTFVFYDEAQTDLMGSWHESREMVIRVCEFQHVVLELHINKIESYCAMTPEELQQTFKNSGSS